MIDFERYKKWLIAKANQEEYDSDKASFLLDYAFRLNVQNLPIIYNQQHLALLTGTDFHYLLSVSNSTKTNYKLYSIPKKHGGYRTILEPFPSLKIIQEWILKYILYSNYGKCVAKNAKAYIPKISIKDNVRLHCNKQIVLNVDLKNFFGSVTFKMVFQYFRSLGYTKSVAVMLSNLCTCHGSLPQGAPTSPMLSNLIFKQIDDIIFSFCRMNNIIFTRYADDMTFSGDFDSNMLISYLQNILIQHGFHINNKKTKIFRSNQRQLVTNIVVNQTPHVKKQTLRKLRQEAYYISKYGIVNHLQRLNIPSFPQYYLSRILGKINYSLFINPKDNAMHLAKNQIKHEINRING